MSFGQRVDELLSELCEVSPPSSAPRHAQSTQKLRRPKPCRA